MFGFPQAEKLMKQIGVKNVKLTEYEMSIAAHLVDPLSMHVSNFPAPHTSKIPLSLWITLFTLLCTYSCDFKIKLHRSEQNFLIPGTALKLVAVFPRQDRC